MTTAINKNVFSNGSSGVSADALRDKLVSDAVTFYFQLIFYFLIGSVVSIIGTVSNIINIVIFIRQGIFTETGSASLLGLAISDFGCVGSMLLKYISYACILLDPPNLPWVAQDVFYILGWPHLMFTQITRGVTAYVAFERCMCVVLPFKVRSIFTPRRSLIIIASIFVCFIISHCPVFVEQQLKLRIDPNTNTTRLVLVSSPNWQRTVDIMWYINSLTFNLGSVVIVFICTIVTVSRVKLSKTWRESMSAAGTAGNSGSSSSAEKKTKTKEAGGEDGVKSQTMSKSKLDKEKKLVRMITSISFIFLLCYLPDLTFLLMYTTHTEIRLGKQYHNLAMLMYSLTFTMESFNSTINFVVYYKMSSRYKEQFRQLFGMKSVD